MRRIEEFLTGAEVLTAADMSNQKTESGSVRGDYRFIGPSLFHRRWAMPQVWIQRHPLASYFLTAS